MTVCEHMRLSERVERNALGCEGGLEGRWWGEKMGGGGVKPLLHSSEEKQHL